MATLNAFSSVICTYAVFDACRNVFPKSWDTPYVQG
jgi:hypothetical protein